MSPDRFSELCAAYGGDPRRWAASERDDAARLAQSEPALRALLAEARRLDDLLDRSADPVVSATLRERLIAAAPRARWRVSLPLSLAGARLGVGLALAGAAGVAVALLTAPMALAPRHAAAGTDPVAEAASLIREPTDPAEG